MGIEQSIQLYTTLFYVFLVIAVLGFGFAAFFFFRFRIPLVFAMETGSAKQKTVEKMIATGDFGLEYSDKKSHKMGIYNTAGNELETMSLNSAGNIAQNTAVTYDNMETTALNIGAEATTMLNPVDETTILAGRGDSETSVLGWTEDTAGQTVPLKRNMGTVFGAYPENTVDMSNVQIGRFDIIEQTVVVNSSEII